MYKFKIRDTEHYTYQTARYRHTSQRVLSVQKESKQIDLKNSFKNHQILSFSIFLLTSLIIFQVSSVYSFKQ